MPNVATAPPLPRIIQGGMGIGVSGWKLAQAVSRLGQLGVVSGAGLDSVMVRRLQLGDAGGHIRRALAAFPDSGLAHRILNKYFRAEGKPADRPFLRTPMLTVKLKAELTELLIASNFAEVFLAREGHDGPVGINYLEKIQMATLPSLYGAMLAGASFVLMGAGIPREIPQAIDRLVRHEQVRIPLNVEEALPGEPTFSEFSPREILGGPLPDLDRPYFLPIVSSATLARTLLKKGSGRIDGFIVEGHVAGGHNAPPRGKATRNERGEPLFGPRDRPELGEFRSLGVPFWLAGGFGGPIQLEQALQEGAAGIQVGTAFALCRESNLDPRLKEQILAGCRAGTLDVFTDGDASPTGFPFKVARLEGTISDPSLYDERPRVCDVGYLRRPYHREDGGIGYRCPAEPADAYASKGGDAADTAGRKCLCNALLANIGLGQVQESGYVEPGLATLGSDVREIPRFLVNGDGSYSAGDVVRALLGSRPAYASSSPSSLPA